MGVDVYLIVGFGETFTKEELKNFGVDEPFEHGEFIEPITETEFFIGTIFEQSPSMRHEPLDVDCSIEPDELSYSKEATMEVLKAESFLPNDLLRHLEDFDWQIRVMTKIS